ncbi:diaminopimelate epimerase [Winogradskyella sp. 3972H.M.0a.05]|uniref:diaminopimelate epimerase n=1 Tax=Winogradskyella sp. 3972H.M.0a.05 TaxID=2950277 RepID=UPI0033907FF2
MKLEFYKYQGTGNDFIIIDNRQNIFDKNDTKRVAELCDRRFGIGADGLILLESHPDVDFEMVYYNADGNQSSMCGNGGRCIVAFAKYLGLIESKATFLAIDGMHHASIEGDYVKLHMKDVSSVNKFSDYTQLDTGSPHYVTLSNGVDGLNVKQLGSEVRYSEIFKAEGINVNFVEHLKDNVFKVRTYERGVEDETLSCGTGVTAVAIAMNYIGETEKNIVELKTPGGDLQVMFQKEGDTYRDVWLCGLAKQVFKGYL